MLLCLSRAAENDRGGVLRKSSAKSRSRASELRDGGRIDGQWNKPDDEGANGCSPDDRSYAVVLACGLVRRGNCLFRLGRRYFELEDHWIVMSAAQALLEVGEPIPEIDFILLVNFVRDSRAQLRARARQRAIATGESHGDLPNALLARGFGLGSPFVGISRFRIFEVLGCFRSDKVCGD